MATSHMQELLTTLSDKCFTKCVAKPSNKLDRNEENCISNCVDRFVESWNVVSQTLLQRAKAEEMALRGF